ncbi:hypothetical protein CK203_096716 [Vitis vinifera]|uniref:Uncharacterized protein n=1 Tax=Vitis vinifera TaxID=29760 RepID=A0A438C2Z9_VITVI|nr:hypothetical protein CK203_096716 [Vitis vinifera]
MLSPRVSDGPRCCYMDGHVILNTQGVLDSVVAPAKGIRTGCPDAPSDGFVSHGVSRSIIILRMAVRDHGDGMWAMAACCDCVRYPFFFFGAVFGTYLFATAVPLILLWLCGKKWLQKRLFHLPGEAAMPTEKGGKNVILFTKEQFNAGLRFPLPALFRNSSTSLRFPPSLFIPTLSGKQRMISSVCRSPALPSNGDRTARFDKGRGEGAGGSLGWMGGAIAASVEAFFSELYLKNSRFGIEGHLVDWVEKASFACEYVINILPRKLAKDEIVPGEHYTVKELPLYQEAKEADAERRRKLLEDRDQKKTEGTIRKAPGQKRGPDLLKENFRKKGKLVKKHGKDVKEPTPPKEFPPPQTTYEGEVMIEEPVNAAPHSISSGPGRMSGLNHSGPSLVAAARLANVAEEAASINRPGNLNPDADAAETAPLEEAGAESQSQPSDDPDRLAIVLVKGPPSRSRV